MGAILWGPYQDAATVQAWSVDHHTSGGVLSAVLVVADEFRLSQQPLVFVAPVGHSHWRWPILSLQIADRRVTATVGPPE